MNKNKDDKLLVSFIAPSGYGKSTAIKLLKEKYQLENIKIAKPLYDLQKMFYDKINVSIGETQDGELLQFFGSKVRKEEPNFLLNEFYCNLLKSDLFLITNDDCRPYDYNYLKELGFIFIKINGFSRERLDHTNINLKSKLEWQECIECDYEIDNYSDIETYRKNIYDVMDLITSKQKHKVRKKVNND